MIMNDNDLNADYHQNHKKKTISKIKKNSKKLPPLKKKKGVI
jgi:hypothetical protein